MDFKRCIRCRDCSDCKNAAKTEHLSLHEEAEMEMKTNSVVLDFENKRIICTLPFRGEEEDFLTTNRDRALKVLEQFKEKVNKRRPDLFTGDIKEKLSFSMFHVHPSQENLPVQKQQVLLAYFGQFSLTEDSADMFTMAQTNGGDVPVPSDEYINLALCYLFRKGSCEVKKFNIKASLEKISVEVEGVLFNTESFCKA